MRSFQPTRELELWKGDFLVGVYLPGLIYTCHSNDPVALVLDQWLTDGRVKIVENASTIFGQAEVI